MGGLSFLAPLYLLAGLAIAIPIALHLFRRRTDLVVEFPAVRLLVRSPVEHQRRKRLRELILLALRITALVLLAAAFARPYFTDRILAADAAITVIAVDRSFSMSAPGARDFAKLGGTSLDPQINFPGLAATFETLTGRAEHTTAWMRWTRAASGTFRTWTKRCPRTAKSCGPGAAMLAPSLVEQSAR